MRNIVHISNQAIFCEIDVTCIFFDSDFDQDAPSTFETLVHHLLWKLEPKYIDKNPTRRMNFTLFDGSGSEWTVTQNVYGSGVAAIALDVYGNKLYPTIGTDKSKEDFLKHALTTGGARIRLLISFFQRLPDISDNEFDGVMDMEMIKKHVKDIRDKTAIVENYLRL